MTCTAITLTGTRQNPNLAVPTTQNTAPILEFRCLYTHDLRRKQKRWQDGILRFHTFNKRVMAYDVPRNYIGDTHWRDDGVFQDGDEFELDRGVLIQVGEAIGSVEQDLTELLEKRRKPQETVPGYGVSSPVKEHNTSTIPMVRPVIGQPPHLRPKSLNALLGTPKGPIGRASLSTRSPHEIRKEDEQSPWPEERPAKRLRRESHPEQRTPQKTNPRTALSTAANIVLENQTPERHITRSIVVEQVEEQNMPALREKGNRPSALEKVHRREHCRGQRTHSPDAVAAELSATMQSKSVWKEDKINLSESLKTREQPQARRKEKETLSTRQDSDRGRDMNVTLTPLVRTNAPSRQKNAAEPPELISNTEASFTSEPPKEKIKLQMASKKPRRKLIYMDLFPQETSPVSRPRNKRISLSHGSRETSAFGKRERRTKEPLSEFHQEEHDRLADRLNRFRGKEGQRIAENENLEKWPRSTDLFLSQEDATGPPASRLRIKEKILNSRQIASPRYHIEGSSSQKRPTLSPKPQDKTIPKAQSTVHDTTLTLSKMDEFLFPGVRNGASTPPVLPRPSSSPPSLASPSPEPATPLPKPRARPQPVSPNASVLSSPGFPTQAPKTASEALASPVEPARAPAPAPALGSPQDPGPSSPKPAFNPLPKFPSPINRPFRPPKSRSPLKKSNSDTSSMRPPPPLVQQRSTSSRASEGVVSETGMEQTGSIWGKEAWDLFGCGRDGVECTYEEFKRKEGLLEEGPIGQSILQLMKY